MCEGTVNGDGKMIELTDIHQGIRGYYTRGIYVDSCIHDEIKYLLQSGVATLGHSCCGHDKWRSHAFIYDSSIKDAQALGYKVYKFRDFNWEEGRFENLIVLKTGTQIGQVTNGLHEILRIEEGEE